MRSEFRPVDFLRRPRGHLAAWFIGFCAALGATSAEATDASHPVVVELFQSQGCSSCPPANANVNALSERPDVLALSFAVTYWDRLGWKDTFDNLSSPSGSGNMRGRWGNRMSIRRR